MKIIEDNFINSQVVLVGGGHAHLIFLKKLSMRGFLDTEVTLINPNSYLLYTGMIPGYIAGHYSLEDIRVDLVKLCEFAKVRFIKEKVEDISIAENKIFLENSNIIGFDILSLDVGVMSKNKSFSSHYTPIKPLNNFVKNWDAYLKEIIKKTLSPNILILGGGVAGVEIALSINYKFKNMNIRNYNILIADRGKILKSVNKRSQSLLKKEVLNQKIRLFENIKNDDEIYLKKLFKNFFNTEPNFIIFSTGAYPHEWIKKTKLDLKKGYVLVDEFLRVTNTKNVFGVGDCIHFSKKNLSKSGVYAVRQAPILYKNIKASLEGKNLKKFRPQKKTLQLISLGKKSALWDKGLLSFSGDFLWSLKNNIDKNFIKKFYVQKLDLKILKNNKTILCAGCGAKVGNNSLDTVLSNLKQYEQKNIKIGLGDDAALLKVDKKNLVFTTDHFRAFTLDLWSLSKIAAIHSMSDIWAMGGMPNVALANIILPEAKERVQQNWLREIMNGSCHIFSKEKVSVIGGHTSVGKEFSIGFSINGFCNQKPLKISGSKPGDFLLLTKPIGSGVLLAAKMLFRVDGEDLSSLFSWMSLPQSEASRILISSNAMTDITGFGLAGHLTKMCISSKIRASIFLKNIPFYKKSMELSLHGIKSSLFSENYKFNQNIIYKTKKNCDLLFDPQTSGGLLASVSPKKINNIVNEFKKKEIFYSIIGKVEDGEPGIIIND